MRAFHATLVAVEVGQAVRGLGHACRGRGIAVDRRLASPPSAARPPLLQQSSSRCTTASGASAAFRRARICGQGASSAARQLTTLRVCPAVRILLEWAMRVQCGSDGLGVLVGPNSACRFGFRRNRYARAGASMSAHRLAARMIRDGAACWPGRGAAILFSACLEVPRSAL